MPNLRLRIDRHHGTRPQPPTAVPRAAMSVAIAAMGLILNLIGCAPALPTYHNLTPDQAKRILAQRSAQIHGLTAQCTLRLTHPRPDGGARRLRLEGALAATPDRLRLQAWKFGQDVLDLTVTPDNAWATGNPDAVQALGAPAHVAGWPTLCWSALLTDPSIQLRPGDHRTWIASCHDRVLGDYQITLNRRTLTPEQINATDGTWSVRAQDPRLIEGLPLAHRLIFTGSQGAPATGQIQIQLDQIKLNPPLPDTVFTPPTRARPIGAAP